MTTTPTPAQVLALELDDNDSGATTVRGYLVALADHYGGTNAVRGIRADYLHERGRVDRLIGYLIGDDQ